MKSPPLRSRTSAMRACRICLPSPCGLSLAALDRFDGFWRVHRIVDCLTCVNNCAECIKPVAFLHRFFMILAYVGRLLTLFLSFARRECVAWQWKLQMRKRVQLQLHRSPSDKPHPSSIFYAISKTLFIAINSGSGREVSRLFFCHFQIYAAGEKGGGPSVVVCFTMSNSGVK